MTPTRPAEPEITWTVPMDRANLILSILAQQPFERIADVIVDLRNQAQAQIQLYQQQMQQSGGVQQFPPGQRIDGEAHAS